MTARSMRSETKGTPLKAAVSGFAWSGTFLTIYGMENVVLIGV